MVYNSKAATRNLEQFIYSNVIGYRSAFQVSDAKRDGTVFVRFRSVHIWTAMEIADMFGQELTRLGKDFTRTDDNKVRLPLSQFGDLASE